MTLYLVRHGAAIDRSRWSGDDLERPLDDRGRIQAEALEQALAGATLRAVWSSGARRCIDTVASLAAAHGLDVEVRAALTEGARAADLLDLVRAEGTGTDDLVMCSHGDLIPEILNRLLRDGMSVTGPRGCEKGSVWALETNGRAITHATYDAVL